ncbi:hypothetical protein, partial [uncultured Cobetia sp.]|uniref:hypothetical protein n=1 Tax=uncultured Cobetia sp. TaxID=410706 RepID=UPI0032B2FF42
MALNHDNAGFLVGERLDAEDITGRLDAIRDEIRSLRRDLSEASVSTPPRAPKSAASEDVAGKSGASTPGRGRTPGPASEAGRDEVVIRIDRPAVTATPPERREPGRYVYRAEGGQQAGGASPSRDEAAIAPQRGT